jgi:molybdenum cofactor cytidylyltransferase
MSADLSTSIRIGGLLLAAGRSKRMGRLKQTLPWPPLDRNLRSTVAPVNLGSEPEHAISTVVASAYDGIAPVCDRMVVVVGNDAGEVVAALRPRAFERVEVDSDAEMFVSICAGLRRAFDEANMPPCDAVLVQPGDHPAVARSTIDGMLAAFAADPARAVMPDYRGKGGHPALVPRLLFGPILGFDRPGGLRQFWLNHPGVCTRVPVHDPLCLLDLDTPGDYLAAAP